MKNIFLILFLLFCFGINAQTRGSAVIKSFTIDSSGIINWEIKYTSREMSFQIERFINGNWLTFSSFKESIELVLKGQKEEFINKNKFLLNDSQGEYRYRLKITKPIVLFSNEIEY